MITFNTDNMLQQKFPFPAPIMDYIFKNVSASQLLKLYNTCKFFYHKFRLNVVEDFEICFNEDAETMVGNSLAICRQNPAYLRLRNLWITKSFTYCKNINDEQDAKAMQPDELAYGMLSRLTYDTLHIHGDITVREYEFLVKPSTLRNLAVVGRIYNTETQQNLSIEDCIERAPQVSTIAFRGDEEVGNFPPINMAKLIALDRQTKLTSLQLHNIPQVPDPLLVIKFLKKHAVPDVDYHFGFGEDDDDNVETFYETINAELQAWKLSHQLPPAISSAFIDLTGKIAVVIGAADRIGRATTILFRQLGASVIAVSRNRYHLNTLAEEFRNIKNDGSLAVVTAEKLYSFIDDIDELFERNEYRFDAKVDILVNTDDTLDCEIIPDISRVPGCWDDNILARRCNIIRQTYLYLIGAEGCIINVLLESKKTTQGIKDAEAELLSFGVRINSVDPGIFVSPPRAAEISDFDYKKLLEKSKKIHDKQAANSIAFLASDSAKLINLSTLNVNPMNLL